MTTDVRVMTRRGLPDGAVADDRGDGRDHADHSADVDVGIVRENGAARCGRRRVRAVRGPGIHRHGSDLRGTVHGYRHPAGQDPGFDDRLRVSPISPVAPFAGRILVADAARNVGAVAVVSAVAVAMGLRWHNGVGERCSTSCCR